MSSADQLTLASYSKTDSTVRFTKDGDSGSTGGFCRSSVSIAWMIGTAIVLALVGVAVGCVALALVLTEDTTTCNCDELAARPSISPQSGSQAPKTDSGNIHYTDPPRVHMTGSAPPGGRVSSTSPGGHISSTLAPSSGSDLASRLVAVENSYVSLRKDVQDLSKSVDGLKTLKTNVSTVQQLSNQLNFKVKTLEKSTTNQTTTSTAFFLSCAQRYDRSTSSLIRGVQYYRDSSSESLCDSSEQGVVWTLIESFSKENDYSSFGSRNGFSFPYPNPPLNPVAYRNRFTSSARTDSTHFRATCNFFTSLSISSGNPSAANDNTAVVALVDYDPVLDGGRGCTRTEFMSIEGRTCRHCTAYWSQSLGEHLHYDPSSDNCTAPNIGGNSHYWGYYHTKPPAGFACTQSPTSTTQYWLGRYTNRTCMGYLRRGGNPASGMYVVEDFDGKPYKVFCDFDSEVGASWTLIEAFERDQADGVDSNSPHRAFVVDRPLSEDSPNLKSYRLSRNRMLSLRSSSGKWRATCGLQAGSLRASLSYQDYARASFSVKLTSGDILSDRVPADGTSIKMDYIGLFGVSCSQCSVEWIFNGGSDQHMHFFADVNSNGGLPLAGAPGSVDAFGRYQNQLSSHRCANGQAATTQWWVGDYISD